MKTKLGALLRAIRNSRHLTIKEVAAAVNGREPRVMGHIKHLVADWGLEMMTGQRKNKETAKMEMIIFWKENDHRRKGTPIVGKTAHPNGFSKNHPLFKG